MFVFKAAVVGAGTMGGQIAQTIAAAGIPVVLKDIDDALVQAGLDEARNVTTGQIGKLAEKGKITAEQAAEQIERDRRLASRARPPTPPSARSIWSVEAVPEKMEIKQAVFAELDAVHAGPRGARLQHVLAVDHRDRRSDAAPGQGRRLPLLLPGLDHAADRDRRGRGDLRRDRQHRGHLRAGDPQAADHLRRGARLRRQPHPQLLQRRGLARAGGEGPFDQEDRRGPRRGRHPAARPLHADQPARAGHGAARRRTPDRVLRRGTLLRAQGHAEAGRRRQTRREDRRRRLL